MPSSPALIEEAQAICKAAAEPWRAGELMKAGIRRASRALGISYRRASAFWYRQPVTITADEIDRLRAWFARYEAEAARKELIAQQVSLALERGNRDLARAADAVDGQQAEELRGCLLSDGGIVAAGGGALVVTADFIGPCRRRRGRRGLAFPSSEFFGAIGR